MVYSLFSAKEILNKKSCIDCYGDIFYDFIIIRKILKSKNKICITYDKNFLRNWKKKFVDHLLDLESLKSKNNFLTEIGKSPQNINEIMSQYMGIIKITQKSWEIIKKSINNIDYSTIDMTMFLYFLIKKNIKTETVCVGYKWGEIDHFSDLELYQNE